MNTIIKRRACLLAPGDIITPPEREKRLWMERVRLERGLGPEALYLKVLSISESELKADKRGPWLVVRSEHSPEWLAGGQRTFPFSFKVRPDSFWTVIINPEAQP